MIWLHFAAIDICRYVLGVKTKLFNRLEFFKAFKFLKIAGAQKLCFLATSKF